MSARFGPLEQVHSLPESVVCLGEVFLVKIDAIVMSTTSQALARGSHPHRTLGVRYPGGSIPVALPS